MNFARVLLVGGAILMGLSSGSPWVLLFMLGAICIVLALIEWIKWGIKEGL